MIIYKDIITGAELFSDVYPMEVVHGCVYKVKGKLQSESTGIDESKMGANPSAEEGGEQYEASSVTGINIVLANKLTQTGFKSKKEYQAHLKTYLKVIEKKLRESKPDRVDDFKKEAASAFKEFFMANYKEFDFYMADPSMDDEENEGMIPMVMWDGETPYMHFFKDGLIEEKM